MLVKTYVEPGFKGIPRLRLSDEDYAKALQRCVVGTADIVIVDRKKRYIAVAHRNTLPMKGLWIIGGAKDTNILPVVSAARNFWREAGLSLPPDRFVLIAVNNYQWKDSAQDPDMGCHMEAHTYMVELSDEELEKIELVDTEYEPEVGLFFIDRKGLIEQDAHPALVDLYDELFPPPEPIHDVEHTRVVLVAEDARRRIYEGSFGDSVMQEFEILGEEGTILELGKHAHFEKFEVFYCLEGGGTIETFAMDSAGNQIGSLTIFGFKPRDSVKIHPGNWHVFKLKAGTRMICYASALFKQSDMVPRASA